MLSPDASVNERLPALRDHEIVLSEDERRACIELAARDTACAAEELGIEFACRPSFLDSRGMLIQLRYEAQDVIRDFSSCWYTGSEHPADLVQVWFLAVLSNDGGLASIWPLSTRKLFQLTVVFPCFQVNEHTVVDYLRCFSAFAGYADNASTATPVLLEQLDHIAFWTPLTETEATAIRTHIGEPGFSIVEESTAAFTIAGHALVGDRLTRARYRISKRQSGQNGATAAGTNDIQVALEDEPLLAGLPDNYRRKPSLAPEPRQLAFQAETDERVRLGPEDANAVVSDLNRRVSPLICIDSGSAVYRRPLPFYGLDLVEVRGCILHGRRRTRFFVWEPGLAVTIDTDSRKINQLNELLSATRGWSLRSTEEAVAYLKFWGDFAWSTEGPLTTVYDRDSATPVSADPQSVAIDPNAAEQVGWTSERSAEDYLNAAGLNSIEGDAEHGYQVQTTMQNGGELFLSRYFVHPTGRVREERHIRLLKWSLREGCSWRPDEPGLGDLPPLDPGAEERMVAVYGDDLIADTVAPPAETGKRGLVIRDRIICGRFEIDGRDFNSITFERCRFRGRARIAHVACDSEFRFLNCVFEKGLELADVTVGGRLQFVDVSVGGGARVSDPASPGSSADEEGLVLSEVSARNLSLLRVGLGAGMLAPGLQVQGDLSLQAVQSLQSIDLKSSAVQHQLEIESPTTQRLCSVYGDLVLNHVSAMAVSLDGIDVTGSVEFMGAIIEQYLSVSGGYFGGADDADCYVLPTRIGHAPDLGGQAPKSPGNLNLYGTIVEKNQLSLANIELAGNLEAVFVRVGTGIWLEPQIEMNLSGRNRIHGDIDVSGANVPQIFRIRWTDIGGSLVGRGLAAGEFRMVGAAVDPANESSAEAARETGGRPLAVGGDVSLQDARIDGEVYVTGVAAGRALNLRHTQVGGDLTLSIDCRDAKTRGLLRPSDPDHGWLRSRFPAGVNLRKSNIAGDVVLSGVDCPDGSIDLADSSITRDIELLAERGRGCAQSLRMEGLRCEGNVDLPGLTLEHGCQAEDCHGLRCRLADCEETRHIGHVSAAGSRIGGRLRTANGDASAEIPGSLDLGFSEIGTLELSVDTFPLRGTESRVIEHCDADTCGVILQRSTIGMLAVHAGEQGYPRPIDLRYAEVKWWEFNRHGEATANNRGAPRVSDEAQDYISLLEGDTGRQRQTYRAIENNLHNWGHEDAADEVHRAMRRWLREEIRKRGPGKGILNRLSWYPRRIARWVGDWLTVDVTSPRRLLGLMLSWLLLSTYLFSTPGNIGPSEPGYLTLPPETRYVTEHPSRDSWGLAAGFWTALQFHVPVAAFTARDEWEPSADQPLIIYQAQGEPRRLQWNLTAEDYANLVLVAHWIAWPVVIVLASRKFLRRAQQQ